MTERFTVQERTEWGYSWEGNDPTQWPTSLEDAHMQDLAEEMGKPVVKVSRRVFVMTGEWQPAPG